MSDLRQLAKEEIIKQLIDKLIFGLIAALIVFGVQKCSDISRKEQIEKEAILRLDSEFVLGEAKVLQTTFSAYISLLAESISLALPPTEETQQQLFLLRVKIESSIEVLSVHRHQITDESAAFVSAVGSLNQKFRAFDGSKTNEYQADLNSLKRQYATLLGVIKTSAINKLPSNT
ncbi:MULTISPECIES: hypothetical protein [unclassified Pseudoalteromonas]|uniref:hypothetical protein n=1 Tax=unclassified Pseudoalteromonas TaxID=194690 RepID=UPI002096EC98|nr:hypothetical protein [Pseudoalteromonas sp. XMcav2-N]MCO7191234.1 hypothetical protein [Pseudoalteromonas sp. XMcav2-N]